MTSMLTPHLSEKALESFTAALGPEAVLTGEDELREFRDPFAFTTWDDYTASAVLMPQTVEEVQQIVRVANRFKKEAPADVTTKDCPHCGMSIPIKAKRCPHCTSQL
jgi:hypothetical protein